MNYYYDLQNTQYGDYLAPRASDGQILSGDAVGINMNGRRYGQNTTKIVTWDDGSYAFTGLKTENGHVVACPVDEAEDFYFAVVTPVDPHDNLTEVNTIDSTQYGITMKMVDFNNPIVADRDSKQTQYLGIDSNDAGLVTTNLDENGYPTVVSTELNLGSLYEGERRSTICSCRVSIMRAAISNTTVPRTLQNWRMTGTSPSMTSLRRSEQRVVPPEPTASSCLTTRSCRANMRT